MEAIDKRSRWTIISQMDRGFRIKDVCPFHKRFISLIYVVKANGGYFQIGVRYSYDSIFCHHSSM